MFLPVFLWKKWRFGPFMKFSNYPPDIWEAASHIRFITIFSFHCNLQIVFYQIIFFGDIFSSQEANKLSCLQSSLRTYGMGSVIGAVKYMCLQILVQLTLRFCFAKLQCILERKVCCVFLVSVCFPPSNHIIQQLQAYPDNPTHK